MRTGKVEPHVFVIFGATGDLTRRKLLPAIYHLEREGFLPEGHAILALGRRAELGDDGYRALAREALVETGLPKAEIEAWCGQRIFYESASGDDAADFERLRARIEELEAAMGLPGNRVFYLALPPSAVPRAIAGLTGAGLNRSPGWTRLVIEKPFGNSLESARSLNRLVHEGFTESQAYRIDHYLGKETVQNLLVFRFANSIFESIWNRDRVDNVQITVAESLGVETRAGYYDRAGAVRDMMQNHLTQLVSLIGMEVPGTFTADAVRYEKVKLLQTISDIDPEDVVLGQYAAGVIDDEGVAGYREEPGVDPESRTETFAAMKLELDTWRWQGVPFYVRTGKRMPRRLTQIAVSFEQPPVWLFESAGVPETHSNVLILTLQPDEGFNLCIDVKVPGEPFQLRTLPLHFLYKEAFAPIPDAYETLLLDTLIGDQTLFVHADEAEASWALFTPLVENGPAVQPYAAGAWGPAAADLLLERNGHRWLGPLDAGSLHESAEG